MAKERKRVAGELAAWQVVRIAMLFGGNPIEPSRINPYREVVQGTREKTPEEVEYQNRRNWKVLDEFFGSGQLKRG